MDDASRWCTSKPNIDKVAESYFQNLFTSSNPTNLEEVLDSVDMVVTRNMNHMLLQIHSGRGENGIVQYASIQIT